MMIRYPSSEAHRKRREYMREWYKRNKERVCERLRADREVNPEKHRGWDRARYERDKTTRTGLAKKWAEDNHNKVVKSKKDWDNRNPEKRSAITAAQNAVRGGRLAKGMCDVCGVADVHGHHDDYAKPCDVVWLCPRHHAERHKKMRAAAREKSGD
jgi:hypothetical protein